MSSITARERQLEADNRVLKDDQQKHRKLNKLVRRLYSAGFWSCDRLTEADAKQLFIELRDAANITPGGSPVPVGMREGA